MPSNRYMGSAGECHSGTTVFLPVRRSHGSEAIFRVIWRIVIEHSVHDYWWVPLPFGMFLLRSSLCHPIPRRRCLRTLSALVHTTWAGVWRCGVRLNLVGESETGHRLNCHCNRLFQPVSCDRRPQSVFVSLLGVPSDWFGLGRGQSWIMLYLLLLYCDRLLSCWWRVCSSCLFVRDGECHEACYPLSREAKLEIVCAELVRNVGSVL